MSINLGMNVVALARVVRRRVEDGALDPSRAQQLLADLVEQVNDLPPEEVRRLLVRISAVLVAVAARTDTSTTDGPAGSPEESNAADRLLTVAEAAQRLGTTERWLYSNHHRLPFARKLSRKALRFSEKGLERWLERNRPSPSPKTWGHQS